MAKKNGVLNWFLGVSMILSGIAVGGLFLDGTTLVNPVLSWMPQGLNLAVGWSLIVASVLSMLRYLKLIK